MINLVKNNGADINWIMEVEYNKEDVVKVNDHSLGFMFYRGYNGNDPNPKKTLRLIVTEKDIHKVVKPYRFKNFETGKAENLQIVIPNDLKFAKAFGKFILEAVKNAEDKMKADYEELKAQAEAAGIVPKTKAKVEG